MDFIESNLIAMGYIKSAYGLKGWVNVKTSTYAVDSLINYPKWYLSKNNIITEVEILDSKMVGNILKVSLKGIADRIRAQLLVGMQINIQREKFKILDKDEYYWIDLIGMEVKNLQDIFIGKVKNLISTGAHDILVINSTEKKEILIPFVSKYIIDVDLQYKKIISDWELEY